MESPLAAVFYGIKSGKITAWKSGDKQSIKSFIVDESQ